MNKVLALVLFLSSVAHAQSVSATSGVAIGGYNTEAAPLAANVSGVKTHTLTVDERKAVAAKLNIKSDDKVGLVGAFYEIKGSNGNEEGYNWVKSTAPDADSVMGALGAVDSKALDFVNDAMQAYVKKAGMNNAQLPSSTGNNSSSSTGTQTASQQQQAGLRVDLKLELVVVGATWCPVCVKLESIISGLKKEQPYKDHIIFTIIEMDQDSEAARKYGIDPNNTAPPKMFLKYNGKIVDKVGGSYGESTGSYLQQKLRQYNNQ